LRDFFDFFEALDFLALDFFEAFFEDFFEAFDFLAFLVPLTVRRPPFWGMSRSLRPTVSRRLASRPPTRAAIRSSSGSMPVEPTGAPVNKAPPC
jgi:hypothetical protein